MYLSEPVAAPFIFGPKLGALKFLTSRSKTDDKVMIIEEPFDSDAREKRSI